MQKIVVANWKMNPLSAKEAKRIFAGTKEAVAKVKDVEVVVCPPVVFLSELARERQSVRVALGVQDLSHEVHGAYTGQVSAPMVSGYKSKWAIVGHSERRALGETNDIVAEKVARAIANGIAPIVCVGESERNDEGAHYLFVQAQLAVVFSALKRKDVEKLTIAYEPVWAIGKSATEAIQIPELYEMVLYIRKLLIEHSGRRYADHVRILYGGSVKPENAAELVRGGGLDGLLVGSASLEPKAFGAIVESVSDMPKKASAKARSGRHLDV